MEAASHSFLKLLIDGNTHHGVGKALSDLGHAVQYVNRLFLPGTPDPDIDFVARTDGLIIVSHDQKFLRKVQQPRFNYGDKASTGYGRIMLCGSESRQPERILQTIDIIEIYHRWAVATGHRFLAVVGDNWIRFDDEPLPRTPKGTSGDFTSRETSQDTEISAD